MIPNSAPTPMSNKAQKPMHRSICGCWYIHRGSNGMQFWVHGLQSTMLKKVSLLTNRFSHCAVRPIFNFTSFHTEGSWRITVSFDFFSNVRSLKKSRRSCHALMQPEQKFPRFSAMQSHLAWAVKANLPSRIS